MPGSSLSLLMASPQDESLVYGDPLDKLSFPGGLRLPEVRVRQASGGHQWDGTTPPLFTLPLGCCEEKFRDYPRSNNSWSNELMLLPLAEGGDRGILKHQHARGNYYFNTTVALAEHATEGDQGGYNNSSKEVKALPPPQLCYYQCHQNQQQQERLSTLGLAAHQAATVDAALRTAND